MFHILIPVIPLTVAGAVLLKRRSLAYVFPVLLTLLKASMTQWSAIYLFTATSLMAAVFLTRRWSRWAGDSWQASAIYAVSAVLIYEFVSNFGVWVLAGCVPDHPALYPLTVEGLFQCYAAALPYAAFHLLRDVPLTVLAVKGLGYLKKAGSKKLQLET